MENIDLIPRLTELGFGRIANSIEVTWGHPECETYLQNLIVSNRIDRQGFPVEVGSILLKLYNVHVAIFKFPDPADKWDSVAKRK